MPFLYLKNSEKSQSTKYREKLKRKFQIESISAHILNDSSNLTTQYKNKQYGQLSSQNNHLDGEHEQSSHENNHLDNEHEQSSSDCNNLDHEHEECSYDSNEIESFTNSMNTLFNENGEPETISEELLVISILSFIQF